MMDYLCEMTIRWRWEVLIRWLRDSVWRLGNRHPVGHGYSMHSVQNFVTPGMGTVNLDVRVRTHNVDWDPLQP